MDQQIIECGQADHSSCWSIESVANDILALDNAQSADLDSIKSDNFCWFPVVLWHSDSSVGRVRVLVT